MPSTSCPPLTMLNPQLPWSSIDTLLLDMDGTLLDLHFDNHFWLEYLPQHYAQHHNISLAMAKLELIPLFKEQQGTLNWYCLDYWTRELELPIVQIKREIAHLIALHPGVEDFLTLAQARGKRIILITNAHPESLSLKLERVALAQWFERLISSHQYGYPKEDQSFWQALQADISFDPQRTLFIDDSLPILRSARQFGIQHLLAVRQPDSQSLPKVTDEFAAVSCYEQLSQQLKI
ncbi:putative hydrolase of the HAD superfamily [Azomonas agilis]|uniref:Putative hydrolase of the HAD superfamily n=1 Tax=Azomonas agilis TaxID=116849 RepID=A0A562I0J4_9GAMM|nr:GMP/IMP nucleotidase [Azomonas agilis]TWH64541.1 putative hydrolase of the HAD superfamily [Azomonas agilis]